MIVHGRMTNCNGVCDVTVIMFVCDVTMLNSIQLNIDDGKRRSRTGVPALRRLDSTDSA